MNYKTLFLIVIVGCFTTLISCSKCYDCKAPFEVKTPDTTYTEYVNQEICTADKSEIETKESQGYICN